MGVAVLAAIFLSNLPEALSSTTGMRMTGQRSGRVLTTWAVVVVVSAISAALGYGLLDGASGNAVGLIQAFAGGAVLTMLVDTMIPEAFARATARSAFSRCSASRSRTCCRRWSERLQDREEVLDLPGRHLDAVVLPPGA